MATDDSSAPAHTTTDPKARAGDPFAYAGDELRGCPACYDGWVYLGEVVVGDDGEEAERIERAPCRRCHPENL